MRSWESTAFLYPSIVEAAALLATFVTALLALIPRETREYPATLYGLTVPFGFLLLSMLSGAVEDPSTILFFGLGAASLFFLYLFVVVSMYDRSKYQLQPR